MSTLIIGILLPLAGTMLGSAFVFFMRKEIPDRLQKTLLGFASGVMVAASVWSLLIPSIEMAGEKIVPAAVGFLAGIAFLLLLDVVTPHLHLGSDASEGPRSRLSRTAMLALAVTLHNLPEGMAVGVCFAGFLSGNVGITFISAMALSIGIAIQNIPEGAIISMPLKIEGVSKPKAFIYGILSGIVEPIAAVITILLINIVVPLLPYLLSFAAGAMIYVVVEELIPEIHFGHKSSLGVIGVTLGFTIMMILDIALG